jgi:xanthine dehydrogenase accessory factor
MARDIPIAIVKGAGDLGTGVAYRLWKCGFRVLCTDLEHPLVIRRTVAFASAIYEGCITVEGVACERIFYADEAFSLWQRDTLPVIADPTGRSVQALRPDVVVDAIMAKHNTGTTINDASCVVALGPGFTAGQDCHAVIETQRGHDLGRVIWSGSASPNTGVPGKVGGEDARRVVRSPCDGRLYARRAIGDFVKEGEVIAQVDGAPVFATLSGILRGLLHDGISVRAGLKIADIDPRGEQRFCFSISDKALAIGGGVLEAVFALRARWQRQNVASS